MSAYVDGVEVTTARTLWSLLTSKPEITVGDFGYATFAAAVATIGASSTNLVVPAGTHSVAADLTIPATLSLRVLYGANIVVANTKTLTINGMVEAGLYQVFSCTGTGKVSFGKGVVKEVYPEWFGFSSTAADTVNAAAVQAAFDALLHTDVYYSGTVQFTQGGNIKGPINVMSSVTIKGTAFAFPQLVNTATDGSDLFVVKNTRDTNPTPFYVRIQDLKLQGVCDFANNLYSGNAINVYAPYWFSMERVFITGHGGMGVKTIKGAAPDAYYQNFEIKNCQITGNRMGGVMLGRAVAGDGGNLARITSCSIGSNGYFGVYSDKIYQLQIRDTEFSGYYYGAFIAAHQAVPVALNGGALVIIEGCSFENNAGHGATATQSIRTGWDAVNQTGDTNNTQTLFINNNSFSIPATTSNDGALDCIHLNYALNVTIENNEVDRGILNKYTINFVNVGANMLPYAKIMLVNNRLNSTPDDCVNLITGGINAIQYTIIDGTPDKVAGLASDILLANDLKVKMNAHAADATEHGTVPPTTIDNVNFPVTTTDAAGTGATGTASLITLTTSLLTAYAAHEVDAALTSGWAFHKAKETAGHTLISAAAPASYDYPTCHQRLMDLKARFNAHDADTGAHAANTLHPTSLGVAARLSNAFRFHGVEESSPAFVTHRPSYPNNDAFRIESNGKMSWGPGNSPAAVDMYMDPSNFNIRTTKKFCADGGLGIGNSVANTNTPSGATVRAIQIFDAAGTSLGYLPVYAMPW